MAKEEMVLAKEEMVLAHLSQLFVTMCIKTLLPQPFSLTPNPASKKGFFSWAARTGSGPMLMRGDIFAASRGGGAGC
jgi:hypothetical protein